MSTDIRMPIGGLFTILGIMLFVYGIMTHGNEMYAKSLGLNMNIWWGIVMAIFGGTMLTLAVKRGKLGAGSAKTAEEQRQRSGH